MIHTWELGRLCLHPIGEIHQLRPTLTYLDILSRKNKRHRTGGGGSDSESDGGPPPDPDEPAPNPVPRKEKTLGREAREAQVSARKSNEKGELQPLQGGLSTIRREMLSIIHDEQDESWTSLDYCDEQVCDWYTSFHCFILIHVRRPENPGLHWIPYSHKTKRV